MEDEIEKITPLYTEGKLPPFRTEDKSFTGVTKTFNVRSGKIDKVLSRAWFRLWTYTLISTFLLLASLVWLIVVVSDLDNNESTLIIPSIFSILMLFTFLWWLIEFRSFANSRKNFLSNNHMRSEMWVAPEFIKKLYLRYHTSQITQNWFFIFILFYGGIFTALIWWLKDVNYSVFEFDKWIANSFDNPDNVVYISLSIIITMFILFLSLTIYRKSHRTNIEDSFMSEIVSHEIIQSAKTKRSKTCRNWFIASLILIVLVIIIIYKVTSMLLSKNGKK